MSQLENTDKIKHYGILAQRIGAEIGKLKKKRQTVDVKRKMEIDEKIEVLSNRRELINIEKEIEKLEGKKMRIVERHPWILTTIDTHIYTTTDPCMKDKVYK